MHDRITHTSRVISGHLGSSPHISPHLPPCLLIFIRVISGHLGSSRVIDPHFPASLIASLGSHQYLITRGHLGSSRVISGHLPTSPRISRQASKLFFYKPKLCPITPFALCTTEYLFGSSRVISGHLGSSRQASMQATPPHLRWLREEWALKASPRSADSLHATRLGMRSARGR